MAKKRNKIEVIDGVELAHVTDIISSVTGVDQGLLYWYGKNGTEECGRLVDIASKKGKQAHSVFEDYFSGRTSEVPPDYRNRLMQIERYMRDNNLKPFATELELNNKELGYIGTTDHVMVNDKEQYFIMDYKTGRKDNFRQAPQLGLYALAFTGMYGKPIEGLCDIFIGKEEDIAVEFVSYDSEMTAKVIDIAKKFIELYQFKKSINKHKGMKYT